MVCEFCKKESTEECVNEIMHMVVCGNKFCEDHGKHCQQCGIPVCGKCVRRTDGHPVCWKHWNIKLAL